MQTPDTIPTLMGKGHDDIIAEVLAHMDEPVLNMYRLSQAFHIRVTFKIPITLQINQHRVKQDVKEYIFKIPFFISSQQICYRFQKNGRKGQYLPISDIESYEPVIIKADQFESYKQFKRKFDLFFIEESQILSLWNSKSAQHGERYKPSDFKSINKAGKHALNMFLINFKGINSTDKSAYFKRTIEEKDYYVLSGYCHGTGNSSSSRDIRISHQYGSPQVGYSSEYLGTGNGTYGILVSRNKYLWMEND